MVVSLALFFVALMLLLAAVLSVIRARHLEQVSKVNQRLERMAFMPDPNAPPVVQGPSMTAALERWLNRVGLQIKPGVALAGLMLVVLSGVVVLKTWGVLAACLWWGLASVVSVFIPQVRYHQKMNKLVGQIPLFIDQVIRGLVTGRNVEGAIKLATEDLQEPLLGVIARAQKSVELGADLGDALRDAAHFYDIKELHMLALAIHTSRVYGGSPREMLESVVSLIRQREQMQRELKAMTGETRVTAWVLGLMPALIAAYMVWMSPSYIETMWNDESGHTMLLVGAGMQVFGALVLWRMVKSI